MNLKEFAQKISEKINYQYIILIFITLLFPLSMYPEIYGVDGFSVLWMANAIRNGALFAENTWLIHPSSFFGYYPFSHYGIIYPLVLSFILNFVEFCSFHQYFF